MKHSKIKQRAAWLRRISFEMLASAEQGHPGSVLSQIEILATLFYGDFCRFERGNPSAKTRDRIIISKGHATMGLYPIFADIGYFHESELADFGTYEGQLRIFGNISIPGVDATSGSLGHGLGVGVGFALSAKMDCSPSRVFVIISEGEMYEGSVWESALFAAHHKLDNLVVVLDRNRKIILGDTEELVAFEPIEDKWSAFGFHTQTVDGHSVSDLSNAFQLIGNTNNKPMVVIANTVKGKGIPLMENDPTWHYWQQMDQETKESIMSALIEMEENL